MIKTLATHTYTAITASKFYTPYFWQPLVSGSLVPKDQVMISNFYLFSFEFCFDLCTKMLHGIWKPSYSTKCLSLKISRLLTAECLLIEHLGQKRRVIYWQFMDRTLINCQTVLRDIWRRWSYDIGDIGESNFLELQHCLAVFVHRWDFHSDFSYAVSQIKTF